MTSNEQYLSAGAADIPTNRPVVLADGVRGRYVWSLIADYGDLIHTDYGIQVTEAELVALKTPDHPDHPDVVRELLSTGFVVVTDQSWRAVVLHFRTSECGDILGVPEDIVDEWDRAEA